MSEQGDAGGYVHQESNRVRPPLLLESVHGWYPGAWGPPAFSLSVASALLLLACAAAIFLFPLSRALFRFPVFDLQPPWNSYYLPISLLTSALAWKIAGSALRRPGETFPRAYAVIFAALCSATFVYALVDRLLLTPPRGNPLAHGLIWSETLAAIALWPRLKRVYPDQRLLLHVAALALIPALLAGTVGAIGLSRWMVRLETSRVTDSEKKILDLASEIRRRGDFQWKTMYKDPGAASKQLELLSGLGLIQWLPDEPVWQAANILGLTGSLRSACDELLKAISETLAKDHYPRLSLPPVRADKDWNYGKEVARYKQALDTVEGYFLLVKRWADEVAPLEKPMETAELYRGFRKTFEGRVEQFQNHFGEHWVYSLIMKKREPIGVLEFARTKVAPVNVNLADFRRWKSLRWNEAQALLDPGSGCIDEPASSTRKEDFVEKVDPADPNSPDRPMANLYTRSRMECYSFHAGKEKGGVAAHSYLYLTYESGPRKVSPEQVAEARPMPIWTGSRPVEIILHVEVPGRENASHFRSELMEALALAAKTLYNENPAYQDGVSASSGFHGSRYEVTPLEQMILLNGKQMIAVQIR
jgi:hypothetical protein